MSSPSFSLRLQHLNSSESSLSIRGSFPFLNSPFGSPFQVQTRAFLPCAFLSLLYRFQGSVRSLLPRPFGPRSSELAKNNRVFPLCQPLFSLFLKLFLASGQCPCCFFERSDLFQNIPYCFLFNVRLPFPAQDEWAAIRQPIMIFMKHQVIKDYVCSGR